MEKFLKNLRIASMVKESKDVIFDGEFMQVFCPDYTVYVRDNTPNMSIEAKVAKRIYDAFKHEDVVLNNLVLPKDDELTVAQFSNGTTLEFPSMSDDFGHSRIKEIDHMEKETIMLHTIKNCHDFIQKSPNYMLEKIENVIVNQGLIIGTDSYIMYWKEFHNQMISLTIPYQICDIIIRSGMFDIVNVYYEKGIEHNTTNNYWIVNEERNVFISYPAKFNNLDIKRVFPEFPYHLNIPISYLKMIIKPTFQPLDLIRFQFDPSYLRIKIKRASGNLISEYLITPKAPHIFWIAPGAMTIDFNAKRLQKVLKHAKQDIITMEFPKEYGKANQICHNYILMPLIEGAFDND